MIKNIKDKITYERQNTAEHLENIISLLPGHVYWKNREGVLLGCNDEQAKDIGLESRQDVVGLTAYDTLPKDLADIITAADNEVMQKGAPKTVEEVLHLADGKKSIWLSRKVPLYDNQNHVIGILGVSLDITSFKRTKKKLQETKHKLEAMTAVSFSVAHELRTPLATLDLNTSNLNHFFPLLIESYKMAKENGIAVPEIPPIKLKLLENVLNNMKLEIKSSFNFIDMLLMKIQPSVSAKSLEVFSMNYCIKQALEHYPFLGEQKKLIEMDLTQDFLVQGDCLLVTHIFYNLLKNALYYIEAAGKGRINIQLQTMDIYNEVHFNDTGKGIPADILPHIFKRFYSKTYHGAGVGLTFSKMVMDSLDGKITCRSVEGKYTDFTLHFPKVPKE